MSTYTIPKTTAAQLAAAAEWFADVHRPNKGHYRELREKIGRIANDWEAITASGILVKGQPRVYPPRVLGIPFSVDVLVKAYPELEVR